MRHRLFLLIAFAMAPYLVPSMGAAEDPVDLTQVPIEELLDMPIGIASHFEESALEVASTVEQVSKKNWKQRGARTVPEALGNLPSTVLSPSLCGGSTFAIRGYTNPALRGVNLRLDGVPLNEFITGGGAPHELLPYQLGALKKIEMIRGPGSAMYGADAFHGVLSLESFSSNTDVVEADARMGTDLYRDTALRVSQAVTDTLRVNGAVAYSGNEDQDEEYHYTDPESGADATADRQNRYNAYTGVLKLESDPKEDVSAKAGIYFYGHNAYDFGGQGRLVSPAGQSVLRDRDLSGGDSNAVMGNTTWTFKLSDHSEIEAVGYGWRKDFSRKFDFTRLSGVNSILNTVEDRAGGTVFLKENIESVNTRVALGYEFNYQQTSEVTSVTTDPDGNVLATRPDGADGLIRRVHSPVLDARTDIFGDDLVSLVYGGRFDDYSDSDDHFSPRAGVVVRPADKWAIKALYGNAYRAISSSEQGGTPFVKAASGEPEVINTYEFTVMREDRELKSYATLFFSDWDDAVLVTQNPTPPPPLARLNGGENRSHGVETGVGYSADLFRADFSGSYVESEDRTNDRDYVAFPAWIFNAGLGTKIPPYNLDVYLFNRIQLDADEGPIASNIPDPESLKDYWRTDLTITWRTPEQPYEIYLNFLNLLDRHNFYPSAFNAEGGTPDYGFTALAGIELRL